MDMEQNRRTKHVKIKFQTSMFWGRRERSVEEVLILPDQFFVKSAAWTPEKILICEIFLSALKDFDGFFNPKYQTSRRIRRFAQEAYDWFLSDDDRWPGSFLFICDHLDLDPSYVRKGIRKLHQEAVGQWEGVDFSNRRPPSSRKKRKTHTMVKRKGIIAIDNRTMRLIA